MTFGIELELAVLLIFHTVSLAAFGKFQIETPFLKRVIKWFVIYGITIGLYLWVRHWALFFLPLIIIPGLILHFKWCRKNGIHPMNATPRKKYYELRNWKWEE
jgi:dolichyl-phosphate-mannose--protein O-mannosyl transferase